MGPTERSVFGFTDEWRVRAGPDVVREALLDLAGYPRWWPEVRAVGRLGDDDALVICRSLLPYSLELRLTARRRDPDRLEIAMAGDLVGWARFDLSPAPTGAADAPGTRLLFTQQVRVAGPLLRLLALPARPAMRWNHTRMMRSGATGLARLLDGTSPGSG